MANFHEYFFLRGCSHVGGNTDLEKRVVLCRCDHIIDGEVDAVRVALCAAPQSLVCGAGEVPLSLWHCTLLLLFLHP